MNELPCNSASQSMHRCCGFAQWLKRCVRSTKLLYIGPV